MKNGRKRETPELKAERVEVRNYVKPNVVLFFCFELFKDDSAN